MKMLHLKRAIKFSNLKFVRKFTEMVPSTSTTLPVIDEDKLKELNITPQEYEIARKTGTDLYLSADRLREVQNAGFFFSDVNGALDLEANSEQGWKLQYLKNMLLLQDYNTLFRDFLQCCALGNEDGLKLTCENRFKDFVIGNLGRLNKFGYNLEIDSLKIMQDYRILRVELYKNLKVNRYENKLYNKYRFQQAPTPLGPMVVAKEVGYDNSFAKDPRPYILATTMLVRSPMKIAVMNQNMTRKLHGMPEQQWTDYVVRFESQFAFNDFFWILPTQNKPKRLRSTRIADFNNVMRGNPFFENKFDLVDDNSRYGYMTKDDTLDNNLRSLLI